MTNYNFQSIKYIISSISECLKWIFLNLQDHISILFFSHFLVSFVNQKLFKLPRKLLFCHMSTKKVLFSKALQEICKKQYLVILLSPFVSKAIIAWASINVQ